MPRKKRKNLGNILNGYGDFMKKLFVVLAFMLFIVGCNDETSQISSGQIPSGIYTSLDLGSEEKVEVKGSEIVFHIKINGIFWDRHFNSHFVYSDGNIVLLPISSNEFDFLHSQCDLKFDGKAILKEEIKTKKKVSVVRDN